MSSSSKLLGNLPTYLRLRKSLKSSISVAYSNPTFTSSEASSTVLPAPHSPLVIVAFLIQDSFQVDVWDDYISWSTLSHSDSEMIMEGTIMQSGLSISNAAIYYDRTANLKTQQLTNAPHSGSYSSGTFVGMAVPSGWKSQEDITITAKTWSQTGQNFQRF